MMSISPFDPVGCGRPLRGGKTYPHQSHASFKEAFWMQIASYTEAHSAAYTDSQRVMNAIE
jgi:hypothetical protein